MKQLLLTVAVLATIAVGSTAQNPHKGDYGYLFCHMNGNGRAWTAYALSRDGLHYHDLLEATPSSATMSTPASRVPHAMPTSSAVTTAPATSCSAPT